MAEKESMKTEATTGAKAEATQLAIQKGGGKEGTVQVLYQMINGRWYAFSQVGEEVYYTEVPADLINEKTHDNETIPVAAVTAAAKVSGTA